jgi:hypothetical protein
VINRRDRRNHTQKRKSISQDQNVFIHGPIFSILTASRSSYLPLLPWLCLILPFLLALHWNSQDTSRGV